ncbi:hypothetical protein RDWZM_001459 [Blomia tropicalis]|uniref:phospholipase A2 n=1 Tax=Blomia tropicalis TaxID=40697 RepID=A0A9Q0MC01_BLOTA|nr:hypothetical protein RDWZM_001459 [Blomia tropicalis]
MVGFKLPDKIMDFFHFRRSRSRLETVSNTTSANRPNTEEYNTQFIIDNQMYHVQQREQLEKSNRSIVEHIGNTIVLYKNTRDQQEESYEMCLEIVQLQLTITLLLTNQREVALRHLRAFHINLIERFIQYFINNGRENVFKNLVELLECYQSNPSWTMAHFAAYFSFEDYFNHGTLNLSEIENVDNPDRWCPLHIAVLCSNERIVNDLITTGMNVYLTDVRHWTVMHYAIIGNTPSMVAFLISRPAFYDQLRYLNDDNCTPVHLAFINGCNDSIQQLLLQGLTGRMLTLNCGKNCEKSSLVNLFSDYSPYVQLTWKEITEYFNMDTFSDAGCPLHWVRDFRMMDRLLNMNAFKVNCRNVNGDTPLISFVKRTANSIDTQSMNKTTSAKGMEQKPRSGRNFGKQNNFDDRLCWLLRLITSGGRVNATNLSGNTALHYAVMYRDIASIQMLIIFGARVNLRNRENQSILHVASTKLADLQMKSPSPTKSSTNRSSSSSSGLMANRTRRSHVQAASSGFSFIRSKHKHYRQQYLQIIQLLLECRARKCPKSMTGCQPDCRYARNDPSSSSSSSSSNMTFTNLSKNVVIGDHFQVCFNQKPQQNQINMSEQMEDDNEMDAIDDNVEKEYSIRDSSIQMVMETEKVIELKFDSKKSFETVKSHESIENVVNNNKSIITPTMVTSTPNVIKDSKNQLKQKEADSVTSVISVTSVDKLNNRTSKSQFPKSKIEQNKIEDKSESKIKNPTKPRLSNMIVFDGGQNENGINPLIEALILNEISNHLAHPLFEYFDIMVGSSFGGTVAALLATNRSPLQIFYYFLQIKEQFRKPVFSNLTKIRHRWNKIYVVHLVPIFVLYDRVNTIGRTSGNEHLMPLWEACRSTGNGLANYRTYGQYYDGSLVSPNPTIDALAHYHSYRTEPHVDDDDNYVIPKQQKQQQQQQQIDEPKLYPIGFVISIGGGAPPQRLNVPTIDINAYTTINPAEMVKNIQYFKYIRDLMFESLIVPDDFVSDRAKYWCYSMDINYARVNFTYIRDHTKESNRTLLNRATIGKLRTKPNVNTLKDSQLLQVLWNVKRQMLISRHKFYKIAKYLESYRKEQLQMVET